MIFIYGACSLLAILASYWLHESALSMGAVIGSEKARNLNRASIALLAVGFLQAAAIMTL